MSKNDNKPHFQTDNTHQKGSVEKPSFTNRPPSKENEPPKKKS